MRRLHNSSYQPTGDSLYYMCGKSPGQTFLDVVLGYDRSITTEGVHFGKLLQSFVSGKYARYAHFGVKGSFIIVNPFVMYAIFINHVTIISVYNYIYTFHYTCLLLITYNREHISQQ